MSAAEKNNDQMIDKEKSTLPEGINEEFLEILNGVFKDYESSFWELKDR